MSRSSFHSPLDFLKLNLQLDTKQFLLHVLLVQAASPPPVQAASPSIPLLSLLDLAPLLKLLRPCSVGQPLHLLGRPMPRGLSNSSTSMMVVLVRARTQGAQATTRFWTACRRCAMEWARSKRHLRRCLQRWPQKMISLH